MADSAKIVVSGLFSNNSDFTEPQARTGSVKHSVSGAAKYMHMEVGAATAGTTIDLSPFTTVLGAVIINKDASNHVDVRWKEVIASKSYSATIVFADADPDTITNADADNISVLKLRDGLWVRVSSAGEAANDGTFLVQDVSTTVITLYADATITADAGDSPTLETLADNTQSVEAGNGQLVLTKSVDVASDIVLTADTAACECEVMLIGT